jgi:hypothetical protein
VKITKEVFYKLNQLDRIEYRQRESLIREKYSSHNLNSAMRLSLLIIIFAVVMDIWFVLHTGKLLSISFVPRIFVVCLFFMFIMFFLDIINSILKNKYIDELNKCYFHIRLK